MILALLLAVPPMEARDLKLSGFVDAFYAWNDNRPADHGNFIPGAGTSAKRDNEFSVNLAAVDLRKEAEPLGFRLTLGWGTAMDVVHAAETSDVWQNVVQASILYRTGLGKGLLLEAGIYPSHIGFESFASKDNWNYTRSWLGELSPYYQTGIKAVYPLGEKWSAQAHLLNGWQVIDDTNRGKSLGWQVAYAGPRLTFSFNGIAGAELPDNDRDTRVLLDTVAIYEVTDALSLGGSLDLAGEERTGGEDARWGGTALYVRYAPPGSKAASALRVDRFEDDDAAISGFSQTLQSYTATFEHRPADDLILKLEGRYDRSTAPVFAGDTRDEDGNAVRDQRSQFLLLLGAVATFGR